MHLFNALGRFGCSQRFDLFPTGHGVPHARPAEWVHVLHDDKRSLLQGHDGQVVVLPGRRPAVQLIARPHVVLHRQGTVFPLAHLQTGGGAQSGFLQWS